MKYLVDLLTQDKENNFPSAPINQRPIGKKSNFNPHAKVYKTVNSG